MQKLLIALFVCLFILQAHAAITIVSTGTAHVTAASTNPLTTIADCPVGSIEVLAAADTTLADTLSSVSDSGSNSWTVIENITGTGVLTAWAYTPNFTTGDVANGGTVTATFAGSSANEIGVGCVSNALGLDKHNLTDQGTAATSSAVVASGTLANANEILMANLATAVAGGAVVCNNQLTTQLLHTSTIPSVTICYLVVSATTQKSSSFTWGNSSNFVTDMISLQAGGAGASLLTLGTGP